MGHPARDAAPVSTLQWAQKKARHAAFYRSPSKDAAALVKKGNVEGLAYPDFFPDKEGCRSSSTAKSWAGLLPAALSRKSTK